MTTPKQSVSEQPDSSVGDPATAFLQDRSSVPPFARGSWQHAVDDALVAYGRTSLDFASPHDAVGWLLQTEGDAAIACSRTLLDAAAPDLLAALKEMLLQHGVRGGNGPSARARAAIAKATGDPDPAPRAV